MLQPELDRGGSLSLRLARRRLHWQGGKKCEFDILE